MTNCNEALAHYSAKEDKALTVKERLLFLVGIDTSRNASLDQVITDVEQLIQKRNSEISTLKDEVKVLSNQIGTGCLISGDTTAAHIVIRSLMGELDRLQANDGQMSAVHKMYVENASKQITVLNEEIEKQKNEIEMWSNKYGLIKKRIESIMAILEEAYTDDQEQECDCEPEWELD